MRQIFIQRGESLTVLYPPADILIIDPNYIRLFRSQTGLGGLIF